jgi:hypothetical protein
LARVRCAAVGAAAAFGASGVSALAAPFCPAAGDAGVASGAAAGAVAGFAAAGSAPPFGGFGRPTEIGPPGAAAGGRTEANARGVPTARLCDLSTWLAANSATASWVATSEVSIARASSSGWFRSAGSRAS